MLTNPNLRLVLGIAVVLAVLYLLVGRLGKKDAAPEAEAPSTSAPPLNQGDLDGVLGAGVGQFHGVQHDNKFICQDCNTCSPAMYRNDVDLRFENLENVRRIRALRGDPFPDFKLN